MHGPSAAKLKERLQDLSPVLLDSLAETAAENANLCSKCESKLVSIENLEVKLAGMKDEIRASLHSILDASVRKRQLETAQGIDEQFQTPQKQLCTSMVPEVEATTSQSSDSSLPQLPSPQSPLPVSPALTPTRSTTTQPSPDVQVSNNSVHIISIL